MTYEHLQRLRYWLEKNDQHIFDCILQFCPSLDSDTVQSHLFSALPKCPAPTEALFLAWLKQFLKDLPNDARICTFDRFKMIQDETGKLTSVARIQARLSLEPMT